MSDLLVQSAIEARLAAWAAAHSPALPLAVQNGDYVPVVGTSYLRGTLMPANTVNASAGGLHKHYHGFYQVDVLIPQGQGVGDALTYSKEIEVLFKAGTTIEISGRRVIVSRTPTTAGGAPNGEGFWMTPVSIWYGMDDFS